jgi:hypothetical protein
VCFDCSRREGQFADPSAYVRSEQETGVAQLGSEASTDLTLGRKFSTSSLDHIESDVDNLDHIVSGFQNCLPACRV